MCLRELNKKLKESQRDEYKKWSYLGVVRQLAVPIDPNRSGKLDTQLYNVDVYGRTNVRNVFRNDKIKNGDQLQLVVVANVANGDEQQLLPAINDEIMSKDQYANWDVQLVIPIGIVSNAISAQGGSSLSKSIQDTKLEETRQLNMLEMLIV